MASVEYRTEKIVATGDESLSSITPQLQRLGAEGWEVVQLDRFTPGWTPGTTYTVLLQRPAAAAQQAKAA